jgi:hypothetical protein
MDTAPLYELDFAEWARQNAGWLWSGRIAQADLEHILDENPSLRRAVPQVAAEAYDDAVAIVTKVTGRDWENVPPVCPYTIEQPPGEPFLPCTQR